MRNSNDSGSGLSGEHRENPLERGLQQVHKGGNENEDQKGETNEGYDRLNRQSG